MKGTGKSSLPEKKKGLQETNTQILNHIKLTVGKPTIVEAQRVLRIVDKLIENIGLLMYLDNDFIMKFNEIGNQQRSKINKAVYSAMTKDTQLLLVKQAKFELEYKPYANLELAAEGLEEEKQQEANRLKKDMETNFRQLLRALQFNPEDLRLLKELKPAASINSDMSLIHESLQCYKYILQKKLSTAADEEESHTRQLNQLKDKIDSLQKSKAKCKQELEELQEERAKFNQERKSEIEKLRSQIEEVKSKKKKDFETAEKKNKQEKQHLEKEQKQVEEKLNAQAASLRTNLQKLKDDNSKEESTLRVKKTTSEEALKQSIKQYDIEMDEKHKEKAKLRLELKEIKDKLVNLKDLFEDVKAERERQARLVQEQKERKRQWELDEKRKDQAAKLIQQTFRNFKQSKKKKKKKKK